MTSLGNSPWDTVLGTQFVLEGWAGGESVTEEKKSQVKIRNETL